MFKRLEGTLQLGIHNHAPAIQKAIGAPEDTPS